MFRIFQTSTNAIYGQREEGVSALECALIHQDHTHVDAPTATECLVMVGLVKVTVENFFNSHTKLFG